MQRQDADPSEHEQNAEHAAEPQRRQADDAREHEVADEQQQLGDHQHEAVFGVPLHLRIVFFEEQRNQREGPEVGQDDHDAAIRRSLDVRHVRASVRYS